MARILVTGASGFIGSHVAERLARLGHQVVASGRAAGLLGALDAPNAVLATADLCRDDLDALVAGCEAVVHCAALSSPWDRADAFWQANVVATERLLAACTRAGVRRFVHLGSPSIYFRFADQLGIGEAFQPPRRWITQYARSKWESELRVRAAAAAGLPSIVLRPRAVFGARDRAILPRLLAVAGRGWFPLVHRGQALIDITAVQNVVDATVLALQAQAPGDGRAYNISNGEPIRVQALVEELFAALGQQARLVPVPRPLALLAASVAERIALLRTGQPEPRLTRYGVGVIGYSQTLDISRARNELGYAPRVSVGEGIATFAQWWRQRDAA